MSKIAIISDIHGNMPALEAVFDDIRKNDIDKIISSHILKSSFVELWELSAAVLDAVNCLCRQRWEIEPSGRKAEGGLSASYHKYVKKSFIILNFLFIYLNVC